MKHDYYRTILCRMIEAAGKPRPHFSEDIKSIEEQIRCLAVAAPKIVAKGVEKLIAREGIPKLFTAYKVLRLLNVRIVPVCGGWVFQVNEEASKYNTVLEALRAANQVNTVERKS